MGLHNIDIEQTVNSLRFTPMYHCHMKEWELLKRFSSSQTARMDSWYVICRYHNKNAIPGIRTIKTIENGIYRIHCTFRVDCCVSFTLPGFFGGLCGPAVCALLIFLQMQLKKQAFFNMDKYIQTFVLSEKS